MNSSLRFDPSPAKKLGAHHYIDAKVQEPVAALQPENGSRIEQETTEETENIDDEGLAEIGKDKTDSPGG